MTHTPEFDRWLREHDDIDMVRLAQYSNQIPALDQWIDQNHRNMVQAAETLNRMSALERDHYNAQPLTRDQQRMFNAIVMLGCVICVALAVWAAVWIGGKL